MGVYVYKVTAKRVKLVTGEYANVAVYAYKESFDSKFNAQMRKQSACFVADRFVQGKNFTGLVVLGEQGPVAKKINCGTFDDYWFDRQPIYAEVA